MSCSRIPLLVLLLASAVVPASGEEPAPVARHFEIRRASGPIEVDGALDEAAWADALTFDLPYEWSPGDNVEPPVLTDFSVTYDDENLYAAWRAHDPEPGRIRAHLMDRDAVDTLVQDDHVLLMIDSFNDERRGFQFRVNPLGVQADAVFSENEGIEDFAFDMIWKSAGKIDAGGYVVEIAIPFDQIRFPGGGARMTWGFDAGRSYPRSVRHRVSSWPHDRENSCLLCQLDKVTGFENLRPGRNFEVTPTVTGRGTERRNGDGELESTGEDAEPGVSVRWGVTPDVTLNATVNPDFSQVEANVAQLEVNTRFALFFPEKRPFFLEGSNFFATPMQAVFTRTVVDPEWGLKLTGKTGKNVFGVFTAEDTVTSLLFPSNESTASRLLDEDVTSAVVRYNRDVGKSSSLGALYTRREGDGYANDVYGVDGFYRLDDRNTLSFQYLRSETLYPEAITSDPELDQRTGSFSGDALAVNFNHQSRHWVALFDYRDFDPDFRADSGFIPQVDLRNAHLLLLRQFWGEEDDWHTRAVAGTNLTRSEDHDGRLTNEWLEVFANVSGPLQSFFEVAYAERKERFRDVLHEDMSFLWLNTEVQPSGAVKLSLNAVVSEEVDLATNRLADSTLLVPALEAKLGRHFNLRLDHTLQRLTDDGEEIFTANLSQARLVYNLNVRTFVRAIFQYFDFEQDAPRERTLLTQLLFSYKINPRTVVFAGYSDNRLGIDDMRLTQTDRTFFLKLGYAWTL